MTEPLLTENPNRFTLFPITHSDIWKNYKTQLSAFWIVEEVPIANDYDDFIKLTKNEQYFIKMILGFFAGSDGLVIDNLGSRFLAEVKVPELTLAYGFQLFMEGIHSEMYSLLIDTYIKDDVEKHKLFNAFENFECIKLKQDWCKRWIADDKSSFAKRLIAFACCEGIFFSSSFAAIFWLKKRGIMKGLTLSNEFISRDEGLHTDLACLVYSKLENKLSEEEVQSIFREAVYIEDEFITQSLPCRLIGMNQMLMSKYIKFVADRLLVQLGYNKIYNIDKCPFEFMEMISLQSKGNFFETNISSYSKNMNSKSDDVFDMEDTEF